ncbi:DUF2182 domain-containing protein [Jannaschia aquimarina]|nr:DUF2182 domain-containing protein [Jannaschia aquimarina]
MAAPHWIALYGTIVAAWTLLWVQAAPSGTLWEVVLDLCRTPVSGTGWLSTLAMWLLMSAAMMLPTALPAFATFDEIADAQGVDGGGRLVAGYAVVWVGFAGLATLCQTILMPASLPHAAAAGLLVAAAAYQWTPLKEACLTRCRQPLTFFMGHWDEGQWRMGMRLGAVCLGCCWALMALGLIGGLMSLGFMALATLLMTLEKLGSGRIVSTLIACACLTGAGYLIGGLT